MAGHIDHGKTALTKALTNIDTDSLKEEKERSISIEPGFAELKLGSDVSVSIVDVPGHERFIRQMIAGVAGIDAVLLVIAADEGIMPQTKEHIDILNFLGVENAIVVITKIDRVDDEMLELVTLDVNEQLAGTVFADKEIVYVDSLSHKGIPELKEKIRTALGELTHRSEAGDFRLPIDQVFTIQGQGTIVRGTIYEGLVREGNKLLILPQRLQVKARQVQVHKQEVKTAQAGQRAAINISGASKEDIQRGHVLVSAERFAVTDTIDVVLRFVDELMYPIKQRAPVNLHIGTAEVMGKLVFFDRNVVEKECEEIYCQLRLDEKVVVRRGDRFILRRPTPVETIAGGAIVDPNGERYRFGEETVQYLQKKREGTPDERVKEVLMTHHWLTKSELSTLTSIDEADLSTLLCRGKTNGAVVELKTGKFARTETIEQLQEDVVHLLRSFHEKQPLALGFNKPEMTQALDTYPQQLVHIVLDNLKDEDVLKQHGQFLSLRSFTPKYPMQWAKRMEQAVSSMSADGLMVKDWQTYTKEASLPAEEAEQLRKYLLHTKQAYALTEKMLLHAEAFQKMVKTLQQNTGETFNLKEAKDALGVSRKYLIPLLELLDAWNYTVRAGEERKWLSDGSKKTQLT
ncbi:selenocysteine-specific translation elongation factor [Bacillus tianshenii]|nr:selenocysteine-specific translation elongation factor [Bacillus tianshenii]